ncbi:uncharacterized protein LOC142357052, partial [Convolutriloba macropyga]|uniref:uncharacterized protein LOC142357052 n=1 Tax=Convolutriloba macropyga TaxID=536237 RepID=UPI003F51DC69
ENNGNILSGSDQVQSRSGQVESQSEQARIGRGQTNLEVNKSNLEVDKSNLEVGIPNSEVDKLNLDHGTPKGEVGQLNREDKFLVRMYTQESRPNNKFACLGTAIGNRTFITSGTCLQNAGIKERTLVQFSSNCNSLTNEPWCESQKSWVWDYGNPIRPIEIAIVHSKQIQDIEDVMPICSNNDKGQLVSYEYPGDKEIYHIKHSVTVDSKCSSAVFNEIFCLHDVPSVTDQPNLIGGPVVRENCDQSGGHDGRCLQGVITHRDGSGKLVVASLNAEKYRDYLKMRTKDSDKSVYDVMVHDSSTHYRTMLPCRGEPAEITAKLTTQNRAPVLIPTTISPDEFTEKLTTQNQADSNTSMLITTTTS